MPYFPSAPGGSVLLPNTIDNTILMDMPAGTVKGRAAGAGTGDPQDLTQAQLQAMVGLSYRNILGRNGGFEVWQRWPSGVAIASGTSAGIYAVDGWCLQTGANQDCAVSPNNALTAGSRRSAYVQRLPGMTGTGLLIFEFPLDTDELACAWGQQVTLSFTALAGATWSPAGGTLLVSMRTGTGAPAKRLTAPYTGETQVINAVAVTVPPGGPITRYTMTSPFIVPISTTQACVQFLWTPVGTAGATDLISFDDVQLEVGSIATPFERRPFESELQACRRHYFKTFNYASAPATGVAGNGFMFTQAAAAGAPQGGNSYRLPVEMRTAPTVVTYNPAAANSQVRNEFTGTDCSSTATNQSQWHIRLDTTPPAGSNAGHLLNVHLTADAGI